MSMQDDAERVEINDRNERERRGLPPKRSGGHTPGNMQAEWARPTQEIMRPDQVAKTMCDALAYAARRASSPIFEDFRANPGHNDFSLRVALPGGKRYIVTVEADPEDERVKTEVIGHVPPRFPGEAKSRREIRKLLDDRNGYIDMPSSDD